MLYYAASILGETRMGKLKMGETGMGYTGIGKTRMGKIKLGETGYSRYLGKTTIYCIKYIYSVPLLRYNTQ